MRLHLASFFSFLKKKPFPNKEDISLIRKARISTPKILLILGLIFAIVFFLSILMHISALFSQEVPEYGGTITEGVIGAPRYINPLLATSETDELLSDLVYSGLMQKNDDETLSPNLATSCEESPDGKSYQCSLPNNILFSDKSPLSSSDVVFTYRTKKQIAIENDPLSDWSQVSIEAIDPKTVVLKTSGTSQSLKQKMSLGIVPETLWSNIPIETFKDSNLNMQPVGIGPFVVSKIKVVNTIPTEVILKPNKKWPRNKPYLDSLIIRSFANQLDLRAGLKNKSIDSTSSLRGTFIDSDLQTSFNIKTIDTHKDIALYVKKDQINNPLIKNIQALSPIVDRNNIIDTIENGYGTALTSPISNPLSTANQTIEISIAVQKDTDLISTAELLSTELNSFGIIAKVNVFDQGLFNEQIASGEHTFVLGVNIDTNPKYQTLIPLYTKSLIHLSSKDIHAETPPIVESSHESLREAPLWYDETDFVWKWFIHK